MWEYNYAWMNDDLCHYGIKGQKWGIRRYQRKDGSLIPAGIKRYAQAGYSEDAYNLNRSVIGKAYDKYTGAHKIQGKLKYDSSSEKDNKARAEKYLADQKAKKSSQRAI